jgi:hypothetical protein
LTIKEILIQNKIKEESNQLLDLAKQAVEIAI